VGETGKVALKALDLVTELVGTLLDLDNPLAQAGVLQLQSHDLLIADSLFFFLVLELTQRSIPLGEGGLQLSLELHDLSAEIGAILL
jgi:hypothetical protein